MSMQDQNAHQSRRGTAPMDWSLSNHIRDQPCDCCFNLDADAADQSGNADVAWSFNETFVCLRRSWGDIEDSAACGCQICSLIQEVLIFFDLDCRDDGDARNIELRVPAGAGNLEISIQYWATVNIQVYISHGRTWNRIRPLPDACTDHLSHESLSFIKSCLQTCFDNHDFCRQGRGGLPARLLDIGSRDDGIVRLIDTASLDSARYIALSYCWGDFVAIKTTMASLERIKTGINVSGLPQTYIDAFTMARVLGIQYLWIDALCIIQDNHQDWERESTKMLDIYANAYLTIAAASATAATQPFLHDASTRPHSDGYDPRIFNKEVPDAGTTFYLKARVIPETGVHSRWHDKTEEQMAVEPLSQRGWALQEQLLSTRALSFSLAEMQWTCQEAVWCECHSELNHRRLFGQTPVSQITLPSDAFRFWHKVIENYSKRSLTDPKDKLTAISGIAETIQQKIQSRYAAGLWVDNIDMDLLWRRTSPATELPRSGLTAPSYSWASIDGEVDYFCFRNGKWPYEKSASVLAVEGNTSREAPLGVADGGRLVLHGPLSSGILVASPENDQFRVILGCIKLDGLADTVIQQTMVVGPDGDLERTACRWVPSSCNQVSSTKKSELTAAEESVGITEKPVMSSSGVRCWAVRLGSFATGPDLEHSLWKDHEFLILGKSPREQDCFERLGLVSYGVGRRRGKKIAELTERETLATITIR